MIYLDDDVPGPRMAFDIGQGLTDDRHEFIDDGRANGSGSAANT